MAKCLAMLCSQPLVTVDGQVNKTPVAMPEGAEGIMFVFRSKKAARNHFGKDVRLLEIAQEKANA